MTSEKDIYKETVFLPRTDFPMRGELPKNEPAILKKWQDMDLYGQIRKASKGRPKWILHDGPPYANGHIHMGHALNKILKDVVNKYWQALGYDAPYVPGWDCHGLPIEWKIEEKYRESGKDKDAVEPLAFRDECRKFAQQWVDTQSAEFQRLGVTGDWKNPYLTMNLRSEGKIVREIHKFLLNGNLYRGVKPVMWSVVEKTALAEAEVEYKEHKSVTVWVKFPVVRTDHAALKNASVVIWTTTPWTLPSNRAIALGDNMNYALYNVRAVAADSKAKVGDRILLAEKLAEDVRKNAKIESWEEEIKFKGTDLLKTVCAHPLRGKDYDFDVPLLPADYVTEDAGTGFVHTAPGHGADDFFTGQKYGLEITDNVSDDGKFRDHVPLFASMEVYTQKGEMGGGNFAVIKALDEAGALLAKGSLRHEYPHSWRSKAPLIFRTTPQWFIAMGEPPIPGEYKDLEALKKYAERNSDDPMLKEVPEAIDTVREENKNKESLRRIALKSIEDTKWIPEKGENRIRAMIEQRPDWCISRQREWGVPIALFVEKKTGQPLKDEAVMNRIGDIFEKEGSDAWWKRPAQDFLGNQYKADDYEQVFDIVDVWFESGCTHAFVVEDRPELDQRADLYLEGSDQHRGWFHSSLLESCGTRGHAPYKAVLTHGFVLDEKGYKMSKSQGNVVDPLEMMQQHGADIIRLWTMLSDYSEDIRIGKDTLKLTADLYRRIRNTFRYLLGALDGFTKEEIVADHKKMPELEQLVLHWLSELDGEIRDHIEKYEFSKLAHRLHNFCTNELSAFYFDIRKDSLYCDRPDDIKRRACRTVLYHLFDCLVTWVAPILAFTAEEAWNHRPSGIFGDEESVHLRVFPQVPTAWKNDVLAKKWNKILKARSAAFVQIEALRTEKIIGSSLEASVNITISDRHQDAFGDLDLAEILIVSKASWKSVSIDTNPDVVALTITGDRTQGDKCARCWKVLPEVAEHNGICKRCADAVRWYRDNRKAA